jgi:hypothetical protein
MTILAMIHRLFDRLSAPENHGALLVERGLGYLGATRNGLSEDELLDVLSGRPGRAGRLHPRVGCRPPCRHPRINWV